MESTLKKKTWQLLLVTTVVTLFGLSGVLRADFRSARDPGPRSVTAIDTPGGPIAGLTFPDQTTMFEQGLEDFSEEEDVADGLGPRFNFVGCAGCHRHPAVGGTSPPVNPLFRVVGDLGFGARNAHPVVHHSERPHPGSALPVQSRRLARRRRPRPLRDLRAFGRRGLRYQAGGLRDADQQPQHRFPDSHAGLRRRADRADQGQHDRRQPERQLVDEGQSRHQRAPESERQRRNDHAVRLEGAEQVATDLLGRGLQRRDGDHQRVVSAGA